MKILKIWLIVWMLEIFSSQCEALNGKGDEKLDALLHQMVQAKAVENGLMTDQCTAVILGSLDWRSSKFSTLRLGLGKDVSRFPDVGTCYFVVSATETSAHDLDENPPGLKAEHQPGHDNPLERHDFQLGVPGCLLASPDLRIFTYSALMPKRGILLSTSQIFYKDPDLPSPCGIRIAFNYVTTRFQLKLDNTPRVDTGEGLLLESFLVVTGVKATYVHGNDTWGRLDQKTGKWSGVVGMADEKKVDLSVSYISYTAERISAIDYSHYVGLDDSRFFTKYPELLSPAGNIAKIFDGYSWLLILISSIIIWVMIYVVSIFTEMSGDRPDFLEIVMYCNPWFPVAPSWYDTIKSKKATLVVLMLTLNLGGVIIVKAFGCNLNAILLKSESAKPVDSACDIVEQKKTILFMISPWRRYYLATSPDPCQVEAAKYAEILPASLGGITHLIYRVATDPDAVFISSEDIVMEHSNSDPRYQELPRPWFHFSKGSFRPYYTGWILQKNSVWKKKLDKHLLRCHQAGMDIKLYRLKKPIHGERENSLQPMNLEHFVFGFAILFIGLTIAFAAFFTEIRVCKRVKIAVAEIRARRKTKKAKAAINIEAASQDEASYQEEASDNIATIVS